MINKLFVKPDIVGAFSSALCLLHCIATPLIFILQPVSVSSEASLPLWWKGLDFLFLIISFFAVYFSSKKTSKQWVSYALWSCWFILTIGLLNEKLALFSLPEIVVFIPAIGLIVLHFYNKKYCRCQGETCCNN